MQRLTSEQIQCVVDWMNEYEQLKGTAIPVRFKEDFSKNDYRLRIPKSFKLFGTTYSIAWDNNRMNDKSMYGLCDYGKAEIILSTTQGTNELSNDRIIDTYYHERTHAILDMMHERDASDDEKFVDIFSKLLRQADESSEF